MNLTDIFIKRPVLAMVVNLLILILGIRSMTLMQVLQFPQMQSGVITVTTSYPGASVDTVAGFITTPLEAAIAQSDGIDYMTSTSVQSISTITVNLRLNYDSNKALAQIMAAVNSVSNQMPPQSQKSVIAISTQQTINAMFIGFRSHVLAQNEITDYVIRVIQPKLGAIQGIQSSNVFGGKTFAVRAWLDPHRLAAHQLTAAQVYSVLGNNNFLSAVGNTKGPYVEINLAASTNLQAIDEFKRLIVATDSKTGVATHLEDVANIELGSQTYDIFSAFDGVPSVTVAIQTAPTANVLEVVKNVRKLWDENLSKELPKGIDGSIIYDATKFVNASIHEVIMTLFEALVIVSFVVFAFLGSPRAVVIPLLAIPLSLVGAFFMMLAFGFSINLLTLLALVLGIGLVVDDAIIVVENVNRHLEEGKTPTEAALIAARELLSPIIAMTIVLVAVYVPIGFMGGLTGSLFTEFAFTLIGAVTISAIVALTLSPMMCAAILRPHKDLKSNWEKKAITFVDHTFEVISNGYKRMLSASLDALPVTIFIAVLVLSSLYFLYTSAQTQLAPDEDQGIIIGFMTPSPTATLQQKRMYSDMGLSIMEKYPETEHVFSIVVSSGHIIEGGVLKPWDQRKRSAMALNSDIQSKFNTISGVQAAAFLPPSLPGSGGMPVQFVIQTTDDFERLSIVLEQFMDEVSKTKMFFYVDKDLRNDMPQTTFVVDRDKAAQMGFDMATIGGELTSLLSEGYVNYFSYSGRAYQVIPQIDTPFRMNSDQLLDYYLKSPTGSMVPLRAMATTQTKTMPESINHFQQLNSATIQGFPFPGITSGDALTKLREIAKRVLPDGYYVDYAGSMRQMVRESSSFVTTFLFALIIIFLALAAQFESFRDPIIILISVPMSLCGALLFLSLRMATLNIYTDVGLVTLIGLISKHGILIVEFANKMQIHEGYSKREAVEHAAAIRFRPILMTTAAMVLGVLPLLAASGAGAASRFQIGLVISTGLLIGTCFTLFVVPAFYVLLAKDHHVSQPTP